MGPDERVNLVGVPQVVHGAHADRHLLPPSLGIQEQSWHGLAVAKASVDLMNHRDVG